MPDRIAPLTALRVFECVARHTSLKKAAQELFVTPAAVSHQVKLLETHLGVQLLRRKNRSIELTDAARSALPKLTEGFNALAEASQRLREMPAVNSLVISVAPSLAACWLMPRLHRFMSAYPDIEVRVSARSRTATVVGAQAVDEVTRWLGDSDVAIFLSDSGFPLLHSELLVPLTLTILASHKYLGRSKHKSQHKIEALHIDSLAKRTLIHDDMGLFYDGEDFWDRMLEAVGLEGIPHQQGPRFSHTVLALEAASEGLGVVATVKELASRELRDGKLFAPFSNEVKLPYSYFLVSAPDKQTHKPLQLFRQWALAEARVQ